MRIAYLDNLRAGTVWLVVAYHVCYLYNGVGILGNIPGSPNISVMDAAASIVYPWFMVLLLLLIFWWSVREILQGSNNPFLYFRF